MAITAVGYDTEIHKAKDEVYAKLPGCCHYKCPAKKAEQKMEGHMN